MKKNTAYTIGSLVILLICAFCFVILPAMTGAGQKQGKMPTFGKYAGREINMNEGSDMRNFAANYSRMKQAYGQQLDEQAYFEILNLAFNSTVSRYAYQKAVKDSGFIVTDEAIRQKMIPYFYDENGKYSSKLYKQTPDKEKEDLRNSIEEDLYTSRFYEDHFGSDTDMVGFNALYGIKESDNEIKFLQNYNSVKRGFNLAYFPLEEYPADEAKKYGMANADKFIKYDLSVITVSDESTAKTVINRLNNKEIIFEDAVTDYSNKSYGDSEGKLTGSYQYEIVDMLTNKDDISKLSNLAKDSITPTIETTAGYSIFKCNNATEKADFTKDETITVVTNYLTNYESTIVEDYFTAKANNLINEARKSDFKTACANQEVANTEIAPFPLNYGNTPIADTMMGNESVLSNASSNENFLKTAFSLNMNDISKPFVMNRNVVVLQYTQQELVPENNEDVFDNSNIKQFDGYALQNCVLNSDKLENNFADAYFNSMMSN